MAPTNKESLQALQLISENQQALIEDLTKRVLKLECKVVRLEATNIISSKVSSLLKQGLDNLQQYERRHCLVVDGNPPPYPGERENTDDKIIEILSKSFEELNGNDLRAVIDKSHHIGSLRENKQSVIIRFISHSVRSKIIISEKIR